MPGVAAIFTADDLHGSAATAERQRRRATGTLEGPFAREVLARDVVRYVGEAVAVVIADTLAHAQDAAELVWPSYDPLEAVTDVEAAAEDAVLLFPAHGSNVAHAFEQYWDVDALEGADVVARARVVQQRVAPVPMETNAIAVVPEDGDGQSDSWTVWVSSQVPFDVRSDLADVLGVDKKRIRVVAPDVGGGFGAKVAGLSGIRRGGRCREDAGPPGPLGRVSFRKHAEPHRTAAPRCSTWRSVPNATARSSACGWSCSPTWARTRSARSCRRPRRRCSPASTRSRGSPRVDGASSRTPRRSPPIEAPAGRRRRRWSNGRWT